MKGRGGGERGREREREREREMLSNFKTEVLCCNDRAIKVSSLALSFSSVSSANQYLINVPFMLHIFVDVVFALLLFSSQVDLGKLTIHGA